MSPEAELEAEPEATPRDSFSFDSLLMGKKKTLSFNTLTPEQQLIAKTEIEKIYIQLDLSPRKNRVSLISDSGQSDAQIDSNVKHIRGILRFAALIGDYQSMIILGDYPPKFCPSISSNSINLYLRYKLKSNKGFYY